MLHFPSVVPEGAAQLFSSATKWQPISLKMKGDQVPLSHLMIRGGRRTLLNIGTLRYSLETSRPCPSTDSGSCQGFLIRQSSSAPSKTISAVPKPTPATLSSLATQPLTIVEDGNSSSVMPNPIKIS